jgi:hypothetical protein
MAKLSFGWRKTTVEWTNLRWSWWWLNRLTIADRFIYCSVKLSHYTLRRRFRERRYSSYSFSTSALDGGEWSASRPRALARGKDPRCPLYRRLGGPQSRSGHRGYRKDPFASSRDRTLVVRSVARHWLNYPPHAHILLSKFL